MIDIIGTELYQWDTGRSVKVTGTDATKVHFANQGDSKAPIMDLVNSEAKIPDYLLQTGKQLCVYAVANGVTIERRMFSVKKRERPESYVYDEDQRNFIYEMIHSAEKATEGANKAAGAATQATQSADGATNRANAAAKAAEQASDDATKAAADAAKTAKSLMVIGEARGTAIHLDDAIDQYLVGLRVFGKTTQEGTPTPDAPVELVSTGASGAINTTVCGSNLVPGLIEGKTYTRNGLTLNVYADRCVCSGTPDAAYAQVYIASLKDMLQKGVYRVAGGQNGDGKVYLQVIVERGGKTTYHIQDKTFQIYGDEDDVRVTIQTGTSTAPVTNYVFYPIVHVGSTPIPYEPYKAQTLTASTPNGLPGIPVTSGGNYTDADGQQWICDEIDFGRGVYVKRIGPTNLAGTAWVKNDSGKYFTTKNHDLYSNAHRVVCTHIKGGIPSDSNKENVIFINANNDIRLNITLDDDTVEAVQETMNGATLIGVLVSPIEIPLSAEEIAAYSALHTYKDHTTVSNDAGAWMDLEYAMDAKKYIDSVMAVQVARLSEVSLLSSKWTGSNSLYSQVVTIEGVTEYSKVDLLPSVEQLAIFHNKDVAFVTENEDGVVTVFAIGDKPANDYTMQVSITEVVV